MTNYILTHISLAPCSVPIIVNRFLDDSKMFAAFEILRENNKLPATKVLVFF